MDPAHTNIRKAAILLGAVDRPTADLLLRQMAPAQAAAVRRAASELDEVAAGERESVLAEFHRFASGRRTAPGTPASKGPPKLAKHRHLIPSRQASGIDLCGDEVRRLRTPVDQHSTEIADDPLLSDPLGSRAAEWLRKAGSDALADFLSREHPQTIAVVFTRLAPRQAAEVLTRLPVDLQAAVVQRLSNLDEADPAVIREVERGLQRWLSEQLARGRRRTAGLSAASNILNAAGVEARRSVLNNLARLDAELASRLGGPTRRGAPLCSPSSLSFDDLLKLDDATLAQLITAAGSHLAVSAMAGAPRDVLARVLRHVPGRVAAELREGVAGLGATRPRDMEMCQQRIVELALELESRSRITLTALRTCSVVA